MKTIKLLLIAIISSLFPFIGGVLLGLPNYILWVLIMTMVKKPNGVISLIVGMFTCMAHYTLWRLLYPQPDFSILYLMFALPSVLLASLFVEVFKKSLI